MARATDSPRANEGEPRFRSPLDQRGFTMLWNVVLMDKRISDAALRTYLSLCFHARQADKCWPGQKVLAAERGCSERAIQRHLTELANLKLITVEQRGKKLSNLYWIEDVRDAYANRDMPAQTAPSPPPSDTTKMSGHPPSDTTKMSGHPPSDTTKMSGHRKKNHSFEEKSINNNNKAAPAVPAVDSVVVSDLMEKLTTAGVSQTVAEALARTIPAERIERHIAQLAYRKASEPGAVLVKAIREDWAAPAGWIRAETHRRKRELQAEKKRTQQTADEAERSAEAARKACAEALWERLTDAERAAVNARAEDAARAKPHLASLLARRPDSPMIIAVVAARRQELLAEMLLTRSASG